MSPQHKPTSRRLRRDHGRLAGALFLAAAIGVSAPCAALEPGSAKQAARPALVVTLIVPQRDDWSTAIPAHGNVAAWQEVVIGPETGGQRVAEVLVNVGDVVKRGQLLARIASDNLAADLAQARAAQAEAAAVAAEATGNAERARRLQEKGFYSAQQTSQILAADQTAQARLAAARARVGAEELRLAQTRIVAPDGGTISARAATVGALAQPGQELFRLVRGNRLEWRAEVTAADIGRLRPGMTARLQLPGQTAPISGRLRAVAPTLDINTRNAFAYVDLPATSAARAGMFARGEFDAGRAAALTLPQSAVLARDGFSYVYRVGNDGRVIQTKVGIGRRQGERVEITGGIDDKTPVVASGVGFLADGDLVRVTGR